MKKVLSIFALSVISAVVSLTMSATPDSLSHIQLEEIVVSGTRANSNTPISFTDISSSDIKKQNAARNIPVILQTAPSIVSFTEDGLGVGNTQFRIRGTDATRINVTLNGMPLNNPESQEVYWVNLPDLSNSLQNIQIQRGVGTSTNGSAAFGASISLKTTGARSESYGEASTAIGSYGTLLTNIAVGSGILNNGLSFDARFSRVLGDGYINNGTIDHTNFYAALSHYTDQQLIRLSYIKGIQHTGITWEGVTADQMEKHGRRYNPAGEYYDEMGNRLYYHNETDNYYSDIVQLTLSRELSNFVTLNAGLSYNHGYGYYENYKQNRKFSEFNLPNPTINGETLKRSDFIRQKKMKNDFYVANLGLTYSKELLRLTFGSMYSLYDGDHYGNLPWIKHWNGDPSDIEWYRNNGKKTEFNIFAKGDYQLTDMFSLFGDLQYRRVDYIFRGVDDDQADLTGDFVYNFFNPKAGLNIRINDQSRAYASVAVGQREPLRSDLKDGIKGDTAEPIKPERMIDYELGYKYNTYNGMSFGANIYYMDYHNQMVQTGKLTDVGYKVMENVKKSYRTGIELEASIPFAGDKLCFDANTTISRNKIKDYTAWFDQYDNQNDWNPAGQVSKDLGTTNISFSPDVVGAASLTWQPADAFYINLLGKYVGKQYLDNTSDDDKSIDAYFVSNLSAGYTFKKSPIGIFNLQMFVNNLFNNKYIANGYASTSVFQDGTTSNYVGYYPQATTNFMVRLSLSF